MTGDHDILNRIRNGDETAFRQLMEQYFVRIAKFTYTIVQDRDKAQDIAQDVFAQLWHNRKAWRPTVSLKSYLFATARNRALDDQKHRGVELRYEDRVRGDTNAAIIPPPDVAVDAADDVEALRRAIDRLPERRRIALVLRYEEHLTHAEVGAALGVSPKAAKELIARTIIALRGEIGLI